MGKKDIKHDEEVLVTIGGRQYIIIDIDRYKKLKENEILLSYLEAMKDYEEGKYHTDIEQHIKNIT